jgi:5-methylcytosine-specific restriction endonuclease McrA
MMEGNDVPQGRRCNRCGTTYPPHLVEGAFRFRGLDASRPRSTGRGRSVCRPCEQTQRDQRKISNRWAVKARDVIRRHAVRFGIDKNDLVTRYGWEPERLAHDAEFQYGNGCTYCGEKYAEMGHGMGDITLDVLRRDEAPYYRTNTNWCCQTCNRKKGTTTPEAFEIDRQVFGVWSDHRKRIAEDPHAGGFLFGEGWDQ